MEFAKKTDLTSLKSDVVDLDTDKSKNIPSSLSNLKSKVNKLRIDKLVPIFFFSYLSKLSDAVKTDVVKKNEYDELVKKVTDIDTSGFVKKQNMILR